MECGFVFPVPHPALTRRKLGLREAITPFPYLLPSCRRSMQQSPCSSDMRVRWVDVLVAFFFFFYVNMVSLPMAQAYGLGGAAAAAAGASSLSPGGPGHEFSLLIGILTRPDDYDARHFLRLVYGTQPPPPAEIHVRFVLCNLTKEEQRVLVALEILHFDDIIILNCTENMDDGKTYTYFSSLPAILPRRYDYVMKADTDTYLRVGSLAASLRPLPREDLYYGYVAPCVNWNPFVGYMSGMGYLLSWDLVEWIAASPIPPADVKGPEDKLVGRWLDKGEKAKNRYSAKPAMYDYSEMRQGTNPVSAGRCSHDLMPETVAIHQLKTPERWAKVLRFFNVTTAVKPSRFYHVD